MTKLQIEIFWEEIDLLQKQYALFFPETQKQYISLHEKDGVHELVFLDGYELSSVITLDIRLLYSVVQDFSFGKGGIWGML